MKFLVDAQLPPALARWIQQGGQPAIHVEELGIAGTADSLLWVRAQSEQMAIVTKDQDFADLWLTSKSPVPLVWIRKGNCSNRALIEWLTPLWPLALERLEAGEMFVELRAW